MPRPIVHVSGPRGVGTSTVAFALYLLVVGTGRRSGYADLSQLQFCSPEPTAAEVARNLAALWDGFRAEGATGLVVAGRADARLAGSRLCWLEADRATRRARLARRRAGEGPPLPGDDLVGRREDEVLALADLPEPVPVGVALVLDTSALSVDACARALLPVTVAPAPPP